MLTDEATLLRPMSPYGASKMMAERILHDLAKVDAFPYVTLRYFNAAGADPKGRTGEISSDCPHLIKSACAAALGCRSELQIFGADYDTPDGTCIRDYVHVADIASAHIKAMEYLRAGGQSVVLNCGYGVGHSVMEIVQAVKRVAGNDFKVVVSDRRCGDPARIIARSDKIREVLAWKPAWDSLDQIITHALRWEEGVRRQQHACGG